MGACGRRGGRGSGTAASANLERTTWSDHVDRQVLPSDIARFCRANEASDQPPNSVIMRMQLLLSKRKPAG